MRSVKNKEKTPKYCTTTLDMALLKIEIGGQEMSHRLSFPGHMKKTVKDKNSCGHYEREMNVVASRVKLA